MKTKKLFKTILSCFMLIALMFQCVGLASVPAQEYLSAKTTDEAVQLIDLGSGYSIKIMPQEELPNLTRSTEYKFKKEAHILKDNQIVVIYEVYATFIVNYGVSVYCNNAYPAKPSAINNRWSAEKESHSINNSNSAKSSVDFYATLVERVLGIKIFSQNVKLTITCDKYGK